MFIAELLTIAKIWNQPKSPRSDEWIKKVWRTNTMLCLSAIRKNGVMSFAGK
jgi:hypothetical protein